MSDFKDAHKAKETDKPQLRTCFLTINNHTDRDIEMAKNWQSACSWCAVGFHVGEDSELDHIHIAAQFKHQVKFSTIKNRFPRAHIQLLNSKTRKTVVKYLSKYEGKLVHEFGEFKEKVPGQRNDLIEWKKDIDAGMCPDDLKRKHYPVYMKFPRCVDEMERFLRPKEQIPLFTNFTVPLVTDFSRALVIIGPEGIGKTEFARACLPDAPVISHLDTLKSIRDFSKGIIFDDMDFTKKPYDWARGAQIHLVDWAHSREIHCRYNNIYIPRHTKKIFCCNERPFIEDGAINRRINVMRVYDPMFRAEEEPLHCVAEGNEPSEAEPLPGAQPRKRPRLEVDSP